MNMFYSWRNIQAGKEIRLVSGSIDNIRDEIEAMKSRNNVKTVDLYTLDNGTRIKNL